MLRAKSEVVGLREGGIERVKGEKRVLTGSVVSARPFLDVFFLLLVFFSLLSDLANLESGSRTEFIRPNFPERSREVEHHRPEGKTTRTTDSLASRSFSPLPPTRNRTHL